MPLLFDRACPDDSNQVLVRYDKGCRTDEFPPKNTQNPTTDDTTTTLRRYDRLRYDRLRRPNYWCHPLNNDDSSTTTNGIATEMTMTLMAWL
jgi:hypothetical protein